VEYFRGTRFVRFAIPYAWLIPSYWPVCVAFSVEALWFVGRVVEKEKEALRAAKSDDPRIARVVLIFAALMFANVGLIRLLR
jgi:ABC-type ATPase with predicted acetyltransferase domain